jgi:hypothetical protein
MNLHDSRTGLLLLLLLQLLLSFAHTYATYATYTTYACDYRDSDFDLSSDDNSDEVEQRVALEQFESINSAPIEARGCGSPNSELEELFPSLGELLLKAINNTSSSDIHQNALACCNILYLHAYYSQNSGQPRVRVYLYIR